jgi:3',5'-cyclic AMP phosphodiesterase CpdA
VVAEGAKVAGRDVRLVHLSDLHFGGHADLLQIEALEEFLPSLEPDAVVVSGDVSQRARHGEFQRARVFVHGARKVAPTLVVPGNHDVEWWKSPLGIRGERRKFAKYRLYLGEDLTPVLTIPGAVIAGALSAHGLALGSLTWNLRDLTVKGHLPRSETDRIREIFANAPARAARVLVLHHNVLPGKISQRMGLAGWRDAQRRIDALDPDVVLCGHDHQEAAEQLHGRLAVSASGTHSSRMRGGRPSVFNLVRIDRHAVHIQHYRWETGTTRFVPADTASFARFKSDHAVVSVAGGEEEL